MEFEFLGQDLAQATNLVPIYAFLHTRLFKLYLSLPKKIYTLGRLSTDVAHHFSPADYYFPKKPHLKVYLPRAVPISGC